MAYTINKYHNVAGAFREVMLDVTADAATQTVKTGLGHIKGFSVGFQSMSTLVGLSIIANKDASGAASNGSLGLSGFTSADHLFIRVFGN